MLSGRPGPDAGVREHDPTEVPWMFREHDDGGWTFPRICSGLCQWKHKTNKWNAVVFFNFLIL